MSISYEPYNSTKFVVRMENAGTKHPLHHHILVMGGRWNSRLKKGGPGWLVPKTKEPELMELVQRELRLETIQTNKKSRKQQTKYHRAVSDSEDEEDEDPERRRRRRAIRRVVTFSEDLCKSPERAPPSGPSRPAPSCDREKGGESDGGRQEDEHEESGSSASSDDFPSLSERPYEENAIRSKSSRDIQQQIELLQQILQERREQT